MTKLLLRSLLVLGTARFAYAGPVETYLKAQMVVNHIPGLSVAVVRGGKTVYMRGFGTANVEAQAPAAPDTVYQLASVTKQFTAAAILLLVDEGRIGLDERIGRYLAGLPDAWDAITVRQLLTHTSGIRDYADRTDTPDLARLDLSPREIMDRVKDAPLEFAPGERWAYSNTNYLLLGLAIEKVSGRPYGEFLAERIFRPLGMTSTRLNDLSAIIPRRADGYLFSEERLRNAEPVSPTHPFSAGALVSSVADLAKWAAALDEGRALTASSRAMMWSPVILKEGSTYPYGFGWFVDEHHGRKRVHHSGSIQGFSTSIVRFPDDGVTVVLLMNSENPGGPGADAIASHVAGCYAPALQAKAPRPIPDDSAALTGKLKGVIEGITSGHADPNAFGDEARRMLFPVRIKKAEEFQRALGTMKSFELIEQHSEGEARVRTYRAIYAAMAARMTFFVAHDDKILRMGVQPEE